MLTIFKFVNRFLPFFLLSTLWWLGAAVLPASAMNSSPQIVQVHPFTPCISAPFSPVELASEVAFELGGIVVLEKGIKAAPVAPLCNESHGIDSVVAEEPPSDLPIGICGGVPGASISESVALLSGSTQFFHLNGSFDQRGCADLAAVLTGIDAPLAPTALELATLSTESGADQLSQGGLLAIFFVFLIVSAGWGWMVHGRSREKRSIKTARE